MNLTQEIIKMAVDQFSVGEEKVKPDADFEKVLGVDSLDLAEFVMQLEYLYGVNITDQEAVYLHTVNDVVRLIADKKYFSDPTLLLLSTA